MASGTTRTTSGAAVFPPTAAAAPGRRSNDEALGGDAASRRLVYIGGVPDFSRVSPAGGGHPARPDTTPPPAPGRHAAVAESSLGVQERMWARFERELAQLRADEEKGAAAQNSLASSARD